MNEEKDKPSEENLKEQSAENTPKKIIPAEENAMPETETVASDQLSTLNFKLLDTEMEVHHHAHNPAEPHHKKNWKSYF